MRVFAGVFVAGLVIGGSIFTALDRPVFGSGRNGSLVIASRKGEPAKPASASAPTPAPSKHAAAPSTATPAPSKHAAAPSTASPAPANAHAVETKRPVPSTTPGTMQSASAEGQQSLDGMKLMHVGGNDTGPAVVAPGEYDTGGLSYNPAASLTHQSDFGPLPVKGPDGTRPMDAYARTAATGSGAPVAIVVGGLGLSQTGTQRAIDELPSGVTLGFSPNGNSLHRWLQAARKAGHEVILQVPMQPYGYPANSPGPHTLTAEAASKDELGELHRAMGRITNYAGVMNYMGGRLLSDADALKPVLNDIDARGLYFLDDGSAAQSRVATMAARIGMPYAVADLTLDEGSGRSAVEDALDKLADRAHRQGSAIGVASAFPTTISAVADWAAAAQANGIRLVGVSHLVHRPDTDTQLQGNAE
ncbi:divergent polysaccharide deacetylase family protein [Pararhizobium mangrovi]|uniref:Divergent polysaccharide deacetylase family protein n=1 Tax=Pararhizobium mangrovi TaxID=2590452 RepID=A0A506TWV6_9HYPH|nr:divergent polysaccharide deacetylase family protein [Pararhizobium mangrovi]TPW26522.1 divergent polysaccharide deacetylase family protein [Pararhizobium mangrovi]